MCRHCKKCVIDDKYNTLTKINHVIATNKASYHLKEWGITLAKEIEEYKMIPVSEFIHMEEWYDKKFSKKTPLGCLCGCQQDPRKNKF